MDSPADNKDEVTLSEEENPPAEEPELLLTTTNELIDSSVDDEVIETELETIDQITTPESKQVIIIAYDDIRNQIEELAKKLRQDQINRLNQIESIPLSDWLEGGTNKVNDTIAVNDVSPSDYDNLLIYLDALSDDSKLSVHISYQFIEKCIYISEISSIRHNNLCNAMNKIIAAYNLSISSSSDSPIIQATGYRSSSLGGGNPADGCYLHCNHPVLSKEHGVGSFIFEVGDSQTISSLHKKAHNWLQHSYIHLVINISIIDNPDSTTSLVCICYDKVHEVPRHGIYRPFIAISFGPSPINESTKNALLTTGLLENEILIPPYPCDSPNIHGYIFEVPKRVLWNDVPGTPPGLPFWIDLYSFVAELSN